MIYFSQKGRSTLQSQNILDILNYCFGKSDRFIVNRNKLLIKKYLQEIARIYIINLKTIDSIENEDIDVDIMKNLFIDLSSMKPGHELNEDVYHMVHYLTILFFDYIFLKTYFEKYFELEKGFDIKNIEEIQYDDKNIHPDVIIPLKLYENSIKNEYIGLSHLCCYGCSVIIDTLGFEFRGINKKYEIKWKSPLEKYFNVNTISSIVEKFQEFEKTLENIQDFSKINKYDAPFESKKLDKCTHRSNLISDDICHFLNYFSNHTDEFIFNIKIEQLIHLGTNLFSRRCFD